MQDSQRDYYLDLMGIQRWVLRTSPAAMEPAAGSDVVVAGLSSDPVTPPTAVRTPPGRIVEPHTGTTVAASPRQARDPNQDKDKEWEALAYQVRQCHACDLANTRTQTVFGVGDRRAQWMIIGEAPGADEDRQGEPFVGRAGQLLNAMVQAVGLQRQQVYIANILKCRPPDNRDPRPEEVAKCEPFLQRQVELLQPRLILAVGRIAAQNLLKSDIPIGKMRGRVFRYGPSEIPVVVTYHPAYLLRSPAEKRKAWEDLKLALRVIRDPDLKV